MSNKIEFRGFEVELAKGCGHWTIKLAGSDEVLDKACDRNSAKRRINLWIDCGIIPSLIQE
jgi:RNase P protein component